MERRDFLVGSLAVPVAAAIPAVALAESKPEYKYDHYVPIRFATGDNLIGCDFRPMGISL